jgi:5-methylcytosine-specific restriction endonuclease McrA
MVNKESEIITRLLATEKWSESAIRKGIRAKFRCEYCDKDLLASVDDYKEWTEDHIIPKSGGGNDDEENIAISCRTCNWSIKGKWNPVENTVEFVKRDQLIQIVREYVVKRRTDILEDVMNFRRIVYR